MATEGLTPLPGATFDNDYNVNVKVPFVLDDKGNKVYQILHYPIQVTANPMRINREETLGYFHVFQRKFLREYLDDYLEIEDIYKMATLSRGWNLVTNEEKLWRRFARRLYKGNIPFYHTWKHSLIVQNHVEYYANTGIKKLPIPYKPVDLRLAPYWIGMDDILQHRFKLWYRTVINPEYYRVQCPEQVDRKDANTFTVEEFIRDYELQSKPVIIYNGMTQWSANQNWTIEALMKKYAEVKFRTGTGFNMTFAHFIKYLETQQEHRPLYLFDQKYAVNAPDMLQDYSVPYVFTEDLFSLAPEERPPYRWILIGTTRTGAPFHTDPRATAAWNAVLAGAKRWALYPPTIHPPGVGPDDADYYTAPAPLRWYLEVYPKIEQNNEPKPIECVQYAGDIIYVPGKWWHCVLNLGTTVAVTQNFVSAQSFEKVSRDLIYDDDPDEDFYDEFREGLKTKRPELFKIFKEVEVEKREKSKKR